MLKARKCSQQRNGKHPNIFKSIRNNCPFTQPLRFSYLMNMVRFHFFSWLFTNYRQDFLKFPHESKNETSPGTNLKCQNVRICRCQCIPVLRRGSSFEHLVICQFTFRANAEIKDVQGFTIAADSRGFVKMWLVCKQTRSAASVYVPTAAAMNEAAFGWKTRSRPTSKAVSLLCYVIRHVCYLYWLKRRQQWKANNSRYWWGCRFLTRRAKRIHTCFIHQYTLNKCHVFIPEANYNQAKSGFVCTSCRVQFQISTGTVNNESLTFGTCTCTTPWVGCCLASCLMLKQKCFIYLYKQTEWPEWRPTTATARSFVGESAVKLHPDQPEKRN